jgi:hypothetical protein
MTQRKLTADEQELAYNLLHALNRAALLINTRRSATAMIDHIGGMVKHGTLDGRPPIQVDRAPTAADIGRRVKVRRILAERWTEGCDLVGFEKSGFFVVQSSVTDSITAWQFCIIDQEAGE